MSVDAARAKSIFLTASELSDPVERANYLVQECGSDAPLRARVEALLRAHDAADSIDQEPSVDAQEATMAVPLRVNPGVLVNGRYKLIEAIGEGGMGTVWLAEQKEPVKRRVAIKLVKAGMDSRQVLARFEAERQALALMDHPNIAKILDGGMTEQGRPFFVMEYVKGVPLTEYCDQTKLSFAERLQLFAQVCHAVQHAHQKGIIHRDLKPSNILVCLYDGRPLPKVIDFGLAKAMHQSLTDQSLHTAHGMMVGTPLYMSPEQAEHNNLDVDTRTDIYSLGVILYELLTGTTPLERQQMKQAAYNEILRLIKEVEPPKPSTRLSGSASLPNIAAQRSIDPKQLSKCLAGDLDWIVMKALDKERSRRYETANGLAADVLRYLAGEPIMAHPPSTTYRLKKFVRRHRPQVIAASLVLLALVAGVVGTTIGLIQAQRAAERERQARQDAMEKQTQAEMAANAEKVAKEAETQAKLLAEEKRQEAERNLAFATKGNEILGSVFAGLDPNRNYETVGELSQALQNNLQKAVEQLDGSSVGDPLVVARLQNTLGLSLLHLGNSAQAIQLLEKAIGTFNAQQGSDHPDALAIVSNLASCYVQAGMLDRAFPLLEEALQTSKATLGTDHPNTLSIMNTLASAYRGDGRLDMALALLEETLKVTEAKFGADHPDTLNNMNNLGSGYRAAGKQQLAVPLLEKTLRLRRDKLGADHPDTINTLGNLGAAYFSSGKLDRALPILEETLELRVAKLGPDHPESLVTMSNLATAYLASNNLEKGLTLLEQTYTKLRANLGPDHPDTLLCMNNLGLCYIQAGRLHEAQALLEENVELRKSKLGLDHPETLQSMDNLGSCLLEVGRPNEAITVLEETVKLRTSKLGMDHPVTLESKGQLGMAYCETQQGAKAAPLLLEFMAGRRRSYPHDSPEFAGELAKISLELLLCDQFISAEELLRESLAIREKTQPDAWTTFNTHSMLGGALLGQKKYAEAEPLLLQGYEGLAPREKTIPHEAKTRFPESIKRLVELYTSWHAVESDKGYDAKATMWQMRLDELAAKEKTTPPRTPDK